MRIEGLIDVGWTLSESRQRDSMRTYAAVVERCPEKGLYVGYVPEFPCAHTQAETLDELQHSLREVIEMLLEDGEPSLEPEFVGTQTLMVG
jgi:predicted RNase H-like HicB family nuclease